MTAESAREALFAESLCSDEVRPAAVLPAPSGDAQRRSMLMRAETLLRALAVIEDSRAEEQDERGPAEQAVRRLEAKVDVLVMLVGTLLQRGAPADPVRALQWSARGVAVELPAPDCLHVPGDTAVFRVQPSDALPEPIELPGMVLAVEPAATGRRLWLRFDALPVSLESMLERHIFRVHRRAVAESRRGR